ncbi:hypothetical protein M0802_009364 [Mischocyttarus mexicanus]|nr:hypothetical protein M0802_009364 [Mischocyttarus mexicanus]
MDDGRWAMGDCSVEGDQSGGTGQGLYYLAKTPSAVPGFVPTDCPVPIALSTCTPMAQLCVKLECGCVSGVCLGGMTHEVRAKFRQATTTNAQDSST